MRHFYLLLSAILMLQPAPAGAAPAGRPVSPQALSRALATADSRDYAVFDADGTLWASDIEEAGIAFFEQQGWLSIVQLPPELRPVPVRPGETLFGYYRRLCDMDDKLCLPWSAQVFAGQSLAVLKHRFDALFALRDPIPVRYEMNGRPVAGSIRPPRIYEGQVGLVRELQARGVQVYIVTASHEEIVRLIVADPRYGFEIPPDRVIGTTTILRGADGSISTARSDVSSGRSSLPGYWTSRGALIPGTTLWSPLPWQEGKVAAIQAYIDPLRRPILAAGDSASDWPMLFYSARLRLWVDHDAAVTARLRETRMARMGSARTQHRRTTNDGWTEIQPAGLGHPSLRGATQARERLKSALARAGSQARNDR